MWATPVAPNGLARRIAIVLVVCVAIPCVAQDTSQTIVAAANQNQNVEDFLTARRVQSAQLAPDGRWALVTTRTMDLSANRRNDQVHLVSVDDPDGLIPLPADVTDPTWAADSRSLTYILRGDGCDQLWSYDFRTGSRRRIGDGCLTPAGGTYSVMRWSPDGRYLAYTVRPRAPRGTPTEPDSLEQSRTGVDVGPFWIWGFEVNSPALRHYAALAAGAPPRRQLRVFDRHADEAWLVSDPGTEVHDFDWTSDGRRIAFAGLAEMDSAARPGAGGLEGGFDGVGGLFVASTASPRAEPMRLATVGPMPGYVRLALSWSPDDRAIAVGTRTGLFIYDPAGEGGPTQPVNAVQGVTRIATFGRRVGPVDWSEDGGSVYTLRNERLRQSLYAVDIRDGAVRDLFPGLRWYGEPSFACDNERVLIGVETVTEPPRLLLGVLEDSVALEELVGHAVLNPELAVMPLRYDTLEWRSADDRWTIHGVLVSPDPIRGGDRLPLVVALLGAAVPANLTYGIHSQLPIVPLAMSGYAVLIPNTRGRLGFGEEFLGALGTERTYFSRPWTDVETGVDELIARGAVDPDRIAVIGFSYGGALAAYGITQTSRYRAAVLKEASGIDLRFGKRSFWGIPALRTHARTAAWGLPIESPYDSVTAALLDRESPIEHVQHARTPTLLEFGVGNINATTGGNPFYQALQYFNVPSRFVVYPRTAHAFEEPVLLADSFRRELDWLDAWLK